MIKAAEYQDLAIKLLEQETSDEMMKIKQLLLLRIALESDIKSTRIPVPANITEVGGYYNLLADLEEKNMLKSLISSALGLPNDNYSQTTEVLIKDIINALIK